MEQVYRVNLTGTFLVTQAVLPDMIDARWRRMINSAPPPPDRAARRATGQGRPTVGAVRHQRHPPLDYGDGQSEPGTLDDEFARAAKFGGIVAPQLMAVALDYGHGCHPACVDRIPGSQLVFGGEDCWFYGPRVRPGDTPFQDRRFYDYKEREAKFAGPTGSPAGTDSGSAEHICSA